MTPVDALVTRIATQLRRICGTLDSLNVPIGPYWYQLASYDTDRQILIEVVANEFLPDTLRLDTSAEAQLRRLGLLPPDDISPNWSIRMDAATDAQIDEAARIVATALTEVYGVPAPRTEAPLRHLQRGPNSFHLDARLLDDGSVELAAQDLGPITASVSGDGEYEYRRTIDVQHVPDLVALLGGNEGDDVIDLLERRWSGQASFQLESVLREAKFPIKLFVS